MCLLVACSWDQEEHLRVTMPHDQPDTANPEVHSVDSDNYASLEYVIALSLERIEVFVSALFLIVI